MCSGTPAPTRRSWARHPSRVVTAQAANFPPLLPFLIGIECNWEHEANDAAFIVWGREVFDRLQPYATGGQVRELPRPLRGQRRHGSRRIRAASRPAHGDQETVLSTRPTSSG